MANKKMGNDSERRILKTIGRWIGGAAGTIEGTAEVVRHPPEKTIYDREPRNEEIDFEASDIDVRHTFITAVSVLIGIWVVIALVYFLFTYLAHGRAISSPPALPIRRTEIRCRPNRGCNHRRTRT